MAEVGRAVWRHSNSAHSQGLSTISPDHTSRRAASHSRSHSPSGSGKGLEDSMQAEAASGEDRGAGPARSRQTSQTAAPTRGQDEAWPREEGRGSE
eukprot:2445729-Rhodomonas_salina.1